MKKLIIIFTLTLLSFYQVHSQTIEYKYSCGDSKATIIWNKSRENNLIYLKTTQGNESKNTPEVGGVASGGVGVGRSQ